ncbi:hypothetical protein [Streptomyces sp. NPDC007856]|uniref:hypothetical protein n=1 Tax=Streptomyces sp. NPDC007856 TaxID=3364781 RepID=UPI003675D193
MLRYDDGSAAVQAWPTSSKRSEDTRAAVGHGAPFADLTGTAGATRRVTVRLG